MLASVLTLCSLSTDYMENVGSVHGKCGRHWTLPIDEKYQYELVSHGRAVNGDCTTTIVVGHSSKCTRKICVRLDEWTLDADIMNVTLTGEADEVRLICNVDNKFINIIAFITYLFLSMKLLPVG